MDNYEEVSLDKIMSSNKMYDVAFLERNEGNFLGYNISPIHDIETFNNFIETYKDIKCYLLKEIGLLAIEPFYKDIIMKKNFDMALLFHVSEDK